MLESLLNPTRADMWKEHFSSLAGSRWMNTAHQGALPDRAADAAMGAVREKRNPALMEDEASWSIPRSLRAEIARLVDAEPTDVVLANSASYGLHLIANGLDWHPGDEVLVARGDFPSNLLPWRLAEPDGVTVREVRGVGAYPSEHEIVEAVGPATRLVCVSWVHSFSGWALDLERLGRACRARGALLVVNGSQAVGVRDLSLRELPIDALTSAGFKWLCGPYGTGFVWLSRSLRQRLRPRKEYWLARTAPEDLTGSGLGDAPGLAASAADHDVFGTANFFNYLSWLAALELWNEIGVDAIEAHVDAVVEDFLARLDHDLYEVRSPLDGSRRSSLVVLRPRDGTPCHRIVRALAESSTYVSERDGHIRVSPHLYNDRSDAEVAAGLLNGLAG